MHFHFISQNQSIVGQGTGTSNTVLQVYFRLSLKVMNLNQCRGSWYLMIRNCAMFCTVSDFQWSTRNVTYGTVSINNEVTCLCNGRYVTDTVVSVTQTTLLRIHDIVMWMRIRIWIRRSMPRTNHDPDADPDPFFINIDFQDANKRIIILN